MIISQYEQRSPEWFNERLGCVTASNASKIITATGKPSTQAKAYMYQLLAEWEAGKPVDVFEPTAAMQNGIDREDDARNLYSFITGNQVDEVGLIYKDDSKLVGASVDGIIGDSGVWECKCPKASTLIGYRLDDKMPSAYFPQVQMQMYVTDRKWADFFSYHPDIKHFYIRVERDDKYIETLSGLVCKFIDEMLDKRETLK